jgi:fatty-acyl-CoA synthase
MTAYSSEGSDSPRKAWMRALEMTAPITKNIYVTLPFLIQSLAERFGSALALLSESDSLTYRALAETANRYARWALAQGIASGDTVCLFLPNCLDYLPIWLGITRVGGTVALLNTNLIGDSLEHSVKIVTPKHIIVGMELLDATVGVLLRFGSALKTWSHGQSDYSLPQIDKEIQRFEGDSLTSAECLLPSIQDPALYIYTSGTTGLAKAARVSHFRLMQWTHWFAGMMDTRPTDRMYNCLPMYHSIGGVVATGATLINGGSVALRRRFSASRFWDEVVDWNCTLFQYIGELCRYLVNSPPHPRESENELRLCCGNGLRPDVWVEFKRRFHIPKILEFYAATESNLSLYNCEGRPGAIGRIPSFLAHRNSVALVEIDVDTNEPIRDEKGRCARCSANQVGEAIGKIVDDASSPGSGFEGYTDKEASDKKLLRNVFVNGDSWYRTGDLMRRDEKGFFFFVDRLGDTFRWKGENVSTTEVADVISAYPGVLEAVAYGVTIPGTEGRAGMVAVVAIQHFSLEAFRQYLAARLPEYARPLFLRMSDEIEATATFKLKKQDLAREGYDPTVTTDSIYFNDHARQAFVKLDAALYEQVLTGNVHL